MDHGNGYGSDVKSTPKIVPAQNARIRVVGVGGGGSNAVNRMINSNLQGVDHWILNTDAQALLCSPSASPENSIQLGQRLTKGLGAGGNPSVGKKSAEESRPELEKLMEGVNLVFIAAGMGGGTGTGAAPVVSEVAREAGALTVAIVTKPFKFEGSRRCAQAEQGIKELAAHVDSLIVIPNDQLRSANTPGGKLQDVFGTADDILFQGVKGISDIITRPGLVNVDFADVYSVMKDAGTALLGIGKGSGRSRAKEAALAAINNDLLECKEIRGAKGCIVNVTGGRDMTLDDFMEASESITEMVDVSANNILGAVQDDSMEGEVVVTVIATGFDRNTDDGPQRTRAAQPEESRHPLPREQNGFDASLEDLHGAKIPYFLEKRRLRNGNGGMPSNGHASQNGGPSATRAQSGERGSTKR